MAEHGKRGPNGGVIDLDDPYEVFAVVEAAGMVSDIHFALRLATFAAREEMAGRDQNAGIALNRAANRLALVISSARQGQHSTNDEENHA